MKKSLFIISFSILFLSSLIANGQIKRTNSQDDYNRWFNRQKASGNEQEAREADTQKNNPFLNNLHCSTFVLLLSVYTFFLLFIIRLFIYYDNFSTTI